MSISRGDGALGVGGEGAFLVFVLIYVEDGN